MKRVTLLFVLFLTTFVFNGCGTSAPDSYIKMDKQFWDAVEVSPKIKYDDAWQRVVYIVTHKFELEMVSKEDGYVRSAYGPSYFSEDLKNDRYKVRIVAKFTPTKKRVEFKIDAQVFDGKVWISGSDSRVAANIRKDFVNSLVEPQLKKQSQPGMPSDSTQSQQQMPTDQQPQ
jgi:hypothetical protein